MDRYATLCSQGIDYAPGAGALVHYRPKSGFADVLFIQVLDLWARSKGFPSSTTRAVPALRTVEVF